MNAGSAAQERIKLLGFRAKEEWRFKEFAQVVESVIAGGQQDNRQPRIELGNGDDDRFVRIRRDPCKQKFARPAGTAPCQRPR